LVGVVLDVSAEDLYSGLIKKTHARCARDAEARSFCVMGVDVQFERFILLINILFLATMMCTR
jgi:hypothetical protein